MPLSDFKALFSRPTPAVDPGNIRRMWALLRETSAAEGAVGIDADVVARALGPEADVPAVWLRTSLIAALRQGGLLAPWQHGEELEDRVFQIAATFPIDPSKGFDVDGLLHRLRGNQV